MDEEGARQALVHLVARNHRIFAGKERRRPTKLTAPKSIWMFPAAKEIHPPPLPSL